MKDVRDHLVFSDQAFVATFEPKELDDYALEFELIREGSLHPRSWFDKLERYHNDQTVFNDVTKRYFEPTGVGMSGNKLVNQGLEAMADCMVGGRTKMFGVYAIGEGLVTVNIRDTALNDEVIRLDILDNGGFVNNRGTTCFYSLFFPKTIRSFTCTESAIFDDLSSSIDVMLLRTLFPTSEQQVHVKNLDSVYVGHIIYVGTV